MNYVSAFNKRSFHLKNHFAEKVVFQQVKHVRHDLNTYNDLLFVPNCYYKTEKTHIASDQLQHVRL